MRHFLFRWSWLLLYSIYFLVILLLNWFVDQRSLSQIRQEKFRALDQENNQVVRQLQIPMDNWSNQRLKIFDAIIRNFLTQSVFPAPNSTQSPPFEGKATLVTAKNGKVLKMTGPSRNEEFGPNWAQHYFLGLAKKGDTFRTKIRVLYSFPISYEQYEQFLNRSLVIQRKAKFWLSFVSVESDVQVFFLLPLEGISVKEIHAAFTKTVLKLSDCLQALPESPEEALRMAPVQFSPAFFIQRHWILILGLLCIPLILYSKHQRRPLWFGFENRFLVTGLLVYGVCLFFFELAFNWVETEQIHKSRKDVENHFLQTVFDFENQYLTFRKNLEVQMAEEFKTGSFKAEKWVQKKARIILYSPGTPPVSYLDNKDILASVTLQGLMPQIVVVQNYPPNQEISPQQLKVEANRLRDADFPKLGATENLLVERVSIGQFRFLLDQKSKNRFHPLKVLDRQFILFWSSRQTGKRQDFMITVFQENHLLELFFQNLNPKAKDYLFALRPTNSTEIHVIQNPYPIHRSQIPLLQESSSSGVSFTISGQKLSHIKYYFYQSEEDLSKEARQLRFSYSILLLFFFASSLILISIWPERLIRPLVNLRHSFQSLAIGKPRIPEETFLDERNQVFEHFRDLAREVMEREKLLPFVARQLIPVLMAGKGTYKGQAVYLVSDLRNFTSLSADHSPKDTVNLLNTYFEFWQAAVTKNEGIILRFIGDAVEIVFLATLPHYRQRAIETALMVARDLKNWNAGRMLEGLPLIQNGVGISESEMHLQIAGDDLKLHMHVAGLAVSRAEELEKLSKKGQFSRIVIDQSMLKELENLYEFADLGQGGFEVCNT